LKLLDLVFFKYVSVYFLYFKNLIDKIKTFEEPYFFIFLRFLTDKNYKKYFKTLRLENANTNILWTFRNTGIVFELQPNNKNLFSVAYTDYYEKFLEFDILE